MNAEVPAALAVAGTALMAVAFFGPFHRSTVSWPVLVEPSASACDAPARIDLAEALGALQSTWAETILRQAYASETDPGVRSAIASALSSSQSLVT